MNIKNNILKISIFCCFCLLQMQVLVYSQKSISGKIINKITQEPIPYANIVPEKKNIGSVSDVNGFFTFETKEPVNKIIISAVGFQKKEIAIDTLHNDFLNVELEEEVIKISEITITPGVNPAHRILREIIKRKEVNNTTSLPDWKAKLYSKLEVDLKNVKKTERDSKFWNQIDFIYDYVDTLNTDGKTFLPVFMSETVSDYQHYSDGTYQEKIQATKTSGMKSTMVTEFMRKLYADVNPYDNFYTLEELGLISPLNDQGLLYYKYFLRDSAIVNGQKIYEMSFFPKQKQTPTFKGKCWVADSSFALTKIEMTLSPTANINFLSEVVFEKTYKYKDNHYVPEKESLWLDFNLQKNEKGKMIGLIGRKTLSYDDFAFISENEKINKKQKEVTLSVDALKHDEQYWDSIRPRALDKREAGVYKMVDSLQNVPIIKTTFDYIQMFFFGYKDFGKFELGPYFYMYSKNEIEGHRFRLGGRTTLEFNPKLRLNGYVAYGTKDEDFKYSGGVEYFFKKDKRFSIEFQYKHDYELLGKSDNAFNEDNILTAFLSKNSLSKLSMVDRFYFQLHFQTPSKFQPTK